MDNNIWFSDINIIFNKDTIFNIIPVSDMSNGAKVNSITRFAFYLSILLYLVTGNYLYFYIFVVTVIVTYIIYIFNTKEFFDENLAENLDLEKVEHVATVTENDLDCQPPTEENPLMNPLLGANTYTNKEACSVQNNEVLEKVDKKFCNKLFQNTSSIFNDRNNQRQFYTVPNTSIPNDQGAFANWLYKTPVSCATGDIGLLKQNRACDFNYKNKN